MVKMYYWLILIMGFTGFVANAQNLRVVSLAPSITKNLYLLDVQDKLVGCTSYCTEALADNKEVVGSAVNVNIEKLAVLQPDLVLAMQLTKPQDLETMKKLGIRVEVFATPKSFEQICSQFLQTGRLVGKEQVANELIAREKEAVRYLSENKSKKNQKHRIFFQIGAQPLFTVLPNTFMNDYIQMSGGVNIAADMQKGTITREAVVLRNPEVIIIATMGIVGEEEKENWMRFSEVDAVKNKKVFFIDSDMACSPTPVNFRKSLEEVYRFVNR